MSEQRALGTGARALLVTAAAVVVMAGLQAAAAAVVPVVLGLFLAAVSLPLLTRLRTVPLPGHRRVPFALAVTLTVVADVVVLAAVVMVLVRSADTFARVMPAYLSGLEARIARLLQWLGEHGYQVSTADLPGLIGPGVVLGMLRDAATQVTRGLTFFVLVVLTLVFALIEASVLPQKLQAAFGRDSQVGERFRRAVRDVQTYLRVKTLVSVLVGAVFGLWLWLLGVEAPVLWGFLAFVLNYIPNIGSVIAALPPAIVAGLQLGLGPALAVLAGSFVINQAFSGGLEPHLMGRSLGLSPLVVIVSLVLWGWIWGAVGVILAVPLTMVLKILMENSDDLRWLAVLLEGRRVGDPGDVP